MKHLFITLFFLAAFVSQTSAAVWYVKTNGSDANAGTSWGAAFQNLQKAINSALPNDEIWVAEGTYFPTTAIGGATNRYKTFYIGINVKLFGGFVGNETLRNQRNWDEHPTILSGDLGTAGDNTDNAYHVVWIEKVGLDMWLDGFTVTGGNANGVAEAVRNGGGIYNNGAAGTSSPTIQICTISGNYAYYRGGGVYNNGRQGGNAHPKLAVCIFEGNTALLEGAGLCNDARDMGSASPKVYFSTFSDNISNLKGGAIMNTVSLGGNASGSFNVCVFNDNHAAELGGGIANFVDQGGISSPIIHNCTFSNNVAGGGGGVGNQILGSGSSYPTITDCTFKDNQAVYGAGLYNLATLSGICGLTLDHCTLTNNQADQGGAIWHNSEQALNLLNCLLTYNSAGIGGAVYVFKGALNATTNGFLGNQSSIVGGAISFTNNTTTPSVLTDCIFENNSTVERGGAFYVHTNTPSSTLNVNFNECRFSGNSASNGGAIATFASTNTSLNLRFYNAIFSSNSASQRGGAYCSFENKGTGVQKLYNCTFYDNTATLGGGAVGTAAYANGQPSPALINCIAWGNSSTFGQTAGGQGGLNIQYSLIQEDNCPAGATCGGTHYNEDPLFVDAASGDFRLDGCSSAIDDGTSSGAPVIDFGKNARPKGGAYDLGAYEYIGAPILPKAICKNITVELDAAGSVSVPANSINNESTGCPALTFKINNQASLSYNCSQIGAQMVTLKVTDFRGQTATCSAIITVRDAMGPTMLCKPVTINLNAAGQATLTVAQIDNGSYDNCAIVTKVLGQSTFGCANVGDNYVILGGVDASNNKGTCTATVTVIDPIIPVSKCKNITANLATDGTVTVAPNTVDNGSTDNCSLSLSLTPYFFNCGNVGINNVTLRATDGSGNFSTCAATVTVNDVTAPNALCKNATVTLNDAGQGTLSVSQLNNGSSDACGIATMTLSKTQFNCSDIPGSSQSVTLTLKDVNNNQSSCTAQITTKDNLAPTAICQNTTVQLGANGTVTVYPADLAANSFDNCSVTSYSPTAKVYTKLNMGNNNLSITVKDWSGNGATCVSVVTVQPYNGFGGGGNRSEEATPVSDFGFKVFPNPTAGDATVDFKLSENQAVALRVFDLTGRIVMNQQIEGAEGSNQIRLEMGAMPNGVYVVEIQADNVRKQKRLVVQHD